MPGQLVWVSLPGPLFGHIGVCRTVAGSQAQVVLRAEDGHDEFTIRAVPCSHLKVLKMPKEGERMTVMGCASEATLKRLLGSLKWGGKNESLTSLTPELITHIIDFLVVSPADPTKIRAISCSSIAQHDSSVCAVQHALDPSTNNWWISANETMPRGVGQEWISFELAEPGMPCRVERVEMRIPRMPHGPLSVRTFHLECGATRDGPWKRASKQFQTLDVNGVQSFAIWPPIDATHVRVVCTRNAARARVDEQMRDALQQNGESENIEDVLAKLGNAAANGPTLHHKVGRMLDRIVASSIGFYHVAFS
jgi:hypothetical protein